MVIVGVMKTVLRLHSLTLHVTFTQRRARGDGTATGCVAPPRSALARHRLGSGDGQALGIETPSGFRGGLMSVYMRGSILRSNSVEYIAPPECRLPIKAVHLSSLLIKVIDLRIHPRYLCTEEHTNHQKEHTHKSPSDKRSAVSDRLRTRVSHGGASRRSVVLFYICILLCSRGRIAIESR